MKSNLPISQESNLDSTVQAFNEYYDEPIELNASEYAAMIGFFTNRGFDQSAAETIAVVVMTQAKKDGYEPMKIMDTLRGLSSAELTGLLAEILNFNRLNTSNIGVASKLTPNTEIERNFIEILPADESFSVVSSAEFIDEGNPVTFTINTTNVKNGSILYWTISGDDITENDIDPENMSGTVTIENNVGLVTIQTLINDTSLDDKTLIFNLKRRSFIGYNITSSSVVIKNTTFSFIADYLTIEYTFNTGDDLDTKTKLVTIPGSDYLGYWYSDYILNEDGGVILEFGGDNTGQGTESVLFYSNVFKDTYPSIEQIKIDCRAVWFGTPGTDPVGLKVTLYKGGAMVKDGGFYGYSWINPTAEDTFVLAVDLKMITLESQEGSSIGQRVAVLNYNINTGQGYLDPNDETEY